MRGGFVHNRILIAALAAFFHQIGAQMRFEHRVGQGRRAGYVDLVVDIGDTRIVCEVELTPDRVPNDVAKAIALKAKLLLIVAPTGAIARRIRRRLRAMKLHLAAAELEVQVAPLGIALKRLTNFCQLKSIVNVSQTLSREMLRASSAMGVLPETKPTKE